MDKNKKVALDRALKQMQEIFGDEKKQRATGMRYPCSGKDSELDKLGMYRMRDVLPYVGINWPNR